jgi:hypothetical protein
MGEKGRWRFEMLDEEMNPADREPSYFFLICMLLLMGIIAAQLLT